ncbi:MAG TPA: hypothetical protein PLI09_24600, partial [Candidatus Hydrogenedentes bacterium]|nr:hypothetical protein [Candidatus Hydrogenedentota bacterium]
GGQSEQGGMLSMDSDKTLTAVFVEGGNTLTMSITGNGTTIPPVGTRNYVSGRTVDLTAIPDTGWAFDHWEGDLTGTTLTGQVVMDSAKNVTAVFSELPQVTLTVSVTGNGTVDPAVGVHSYPQDTTFLLRATPDTGWAFDHWDGDISGFDNPYIMHMDSNKSVTAVFVEGGYSLTIATEGNGTTFPAPGVWNYVSGRTATVVAIANTDWVFDHWEGDASGTSGTANILMDGNKSITAVFISNISYSLTTAVVGNGTIDPPVGISYYAGGSEVTISATADADWVFDHWEGDLSGWVNPTVITMDADKTVTAVFSPKDYTLTIAVDGQGTTSPPAGAYPVLNGREFQILAEPPAEGGWVFSHWEGDASGNENPLTVITDGDKTITAVFVEAYALSTSVFGNGTLDPPAGFSWIAASTEVNITATPAEGWTFLHWEGDLSGENNPLTFTMDGPKYITGVFVEIVTFTLTTQVVGEGTVDPAGTNSYVMGTSVEITAAPAQGWHFVEWQGNASGSENPLTIQIENNLTITAVFALTNYSLTTNVTGNGSVDPAGVTTHPYGSDITLTATAAEHWSFQEWQGDLTGSANPVQLLIDGDKTVTAVFVLDNHTLTTNVLGSGSVDPAGATSQPYGSEVTLTATPEGGWTFQEWQGDLTGSTNPAQLMMDGDKTVTAVFIPLHSLTTTVIGNGSVDPAGTTTYPEGTEVTLTAAPDGGWIFQEWQGDLTGSTNPAQLVMDGDKTVTAVFAEEVEGEGVSEGAEEGEGAMEGSVEGAEEGEGVVEGSMEGSVEGVMEGEGAVEGEGEVNDGIHSADQNGDHQVNLSELLRVIQFFNSDGFHCEAGTEDGYAPGPGDTSCALHDSDYNAQDWRISLSELLRVIQFFNSGGYHYCPGEDTEDGYCPGLA